jgi:hypothetical protein
MKNILEIDTSKYSHYAFVKNKTNIQIFIEHPEEDVLYEYYDLYSSNNFVIIAFLTKENPEVDHVFKVTSDEGIEYIQIDSYEKNSDFINNNYDKDNTVFMYTDSVSMPTVAGSSNPTSIYEDRCDLNKFGPVSFIAPDNGLGENLLDYTIHEISNVLDVKFSFFGSIGNFHVVKMQCKEYPETAHKNVSGVVGIARTFVGIIKMIIEWSETTKEPWNSTERMAIAAANGLDKIGIPEEVVNEINEYQEDMPVKLFLLGDPNCRGILQEKSELPPLFKKWFLSKIRYESLNSLSSNNEELQIPNQVLEEEKINTFQLIYNFFLLQGIDASSKSLLDLNELINSGEFKDYLNDGLNTKKLLKKAMHF